MIAAHALTMAALLLAAAFAQPMGIAPEHVPSLVAAGVSGLIGLAIGDAALARHLAAELLEHQPDTPPQHHTPQGEARE